MDLEEVLKSNDKKAYENMHTGRWLRYYNKKWIVYGRFNGHIKILYEGKAFKKAIKTADTLGC